MKQPAFMFYTGDWLKDPRLSMCSPSTRGIWIDLMCAMHELGRSGQVTGTVEQLCRICRCTAAEMTAALNEIRLTKTGEVAERSDIVTITCRRMKREADERLAGNERVKKHRSNANVTGTKRESNAPSSYSYSSSVTEREQESEKEPKNPLTHPLGSALLLGAGFTEFQRETLSPKQYSQLDGAVQRLQKAQATVAHVETARQCWWGARPPNFDQLADEALKAMNGNSAPKKAEKNRGFVC